MTELKPCPFCGFEPVMDCLMETANIICPNCNAHIFKMAKSHEEAKAEAIEAWNRRSGNEQEKHMPVLS